jgi:hypothetical protein
MADHSRVLASPRRQAFMAQIRATYAMPLAVLLNVVRNRDSYTPLYRTAALRNVVCAAPLDVTQGRCFAERRRLCRSHFAI